MAQLPARFADLGGSGDMPHIRPPPVVLIDLRELRFLGSTGLSILVASAGRASLRGIGHEIVPSEGVRRLLAMTGVDGHVTTREDLPAD